MTAAFLPFYQALLWEHDLSPLTASADNYSGVFLTTPSPAYGHAPFRLMVVGQETRGWNGKLTKLVDARNTDSLKAYVTQSIDIYQKRRLRKPGQSRFLQFLRHTERQLGCRHMPYIGPISTHAIIERRRHGTDLKKRLAP